MPPTLVYLSLGSNLGDRAANLNTAISALAGIGVRVSKISGFYETEPVDFLDQPWFLNCALEAETDLPPLDLLHALRAIEQQMGSKKAFAKGPRLMDLDVLLYGRETITTPELQIPHPRMLSRNFVLVPLAEIAPDYFHPAWNATVKEFLAKTSDHSAVRPYGSNSDQPPKAPPA